MAPGLKATEARIEVKPKGLFYGWWIVIASAAVNLLAGGTFFYGFSAFFNPIRQTFGWTYAVTSLAFVLQRLEGGIIGPIAGFLVDRLGPRVLMQVGLAVAGIGFLLMSRINSLWSFMATFGLVAVGFSLGTFGVTTTAVANWFIRKRGRALSLMYVGFGASGLIVPLLIMLIDNLGWRQSLVIAGISIWVVGLPLTLILRQRPEQYGLLPDGDSLTPGAPALQPMGTVDFSPREAVRTAAFWLMCAAFLIQQIATSAIFVHIVPALESVGISRVTAGLAISGMTLASLIGRLGFGFLGDYVNKRYLLAIAFVFQIIGVLVLAYVRAGAAWLIVLFLLTYGPGYGAPIPLRPALQGDYFGRKNFGTIQGLMWTVTMFGGLLSPVFAGWIYDIRGSYWLAFVILAFTTIPAIPLILWAKPPRPLGGGRVSQGLPSSP